MNDKIDKIISEIQRKVFHDNAMYHFANECYQDNLKHQTIS